MPPGPDVRVKITEAYARLVARDVYFWAWAMVNVYNRRLYFSKITQQQYTGPSPQAPVNRFTMLTDYAPAEQRNVACANQDVVYGMGALGLDLSPVVIQVPDFGERFWVYQIVDLRTDSFVQIGVIEATSNWDADDKWSTALIFSVSKVTHLGKRPVNFLFGAGPDLANPAGGDWKIRFQANFLFPQ